MFYKFENGKLISTCTKKIDNTYHDILFNENELNKLNNGYSYINGNIVETDESKKLLLEKEIEIVNQEFQTTISSFTSGYSQAERDGWELQKQEAKNVINGLGSEVLQAICNENGITINDFANLIITKEKEFSLIYAKALGIKQKKLSLLTI